jgi:TolB protein
VYSRSEASLWSVASGGGEAHRVYDRMRYVYDPACAASRDQIVFSAVLPGAQWALLKATLDPKDGTFRGEPSQVLVAGAGAPRFLAISRDARRMAYSALSQQSNLMSLPLTAGGEAAGPRKPLTAETGRNTRPAFSPDGSHIAFEKWAQNTNPDVWVMNADGSNPVQITADPGQDGSPSFTPDGRSVVFLSTRNGRQGLWSADLDTQTPRLLFEPARKIELPRLSPSGRLVAFGASDITGNVWTRTLEGGVEEQVTHDPEFMGYPAWSPDSRRLAVQMRRGDQTNVAVVLLAGGAVEQLTFDEGQSWAYSWSPDGGRVAFAGSRGGLWNIFAVDVATRTVRQLTRQERLDTYVRYPAWSPRGTQMVYEESLSTGNVWMLEDVP